MEDLAAARRFYTEVLGLSVHYEDDVSAVFDFGNTLVNCLAASAAPELLAPAPVPPPAAGSRVVLTIDVTDVDAICAQRTARGATLLNGPMDRPWGIRTASVQDPAGHVWELAAPLPRT